MRYEKKDFLLLVSIFLCAFHVGAQDFHDKWVVITSINYPTQAVQKLAALSDWRVVIVGDKKTPSDWSWPGCVYLSPEKQIELNYRITKFLPWNHYCRKAIGYLYAIQHGARIIYDTDDDNILMYDTVVYEPAKTTMNVVSSEKSVFNPYVYFGQPTVWPRGYPLKMILADNAGSIDSGQVCNYIQQGLANEDPDVDAIFRLTRGGETLFEQKPSISYKRGILCPFNSQNTIFHYEAFWGLLLPITTSFRVCDIWRGYCTQRLLWDIGGSLSFTAPTVYQKRNEHDLLKDFVDEIDLYTKADKLVHFLLSWGSQKGSIQQRIMALTNDMIQYGYYKPLEAEFTQAWLLDLLDSGYEFPSIKT